MDDNTEVSSPPDSRDDTREVPDSIDSFPTNGQPVIDTMLNEMLVSLRGYAPLRHDCMYA